jgi:hypothetical protein
MTQEYIPFPEIVDELRRLCIQAVTGTLFVATRANRSAQLILDKGEIVFVYFFNKRGKEALELMSTIRAGRFRFQEGTVTRRTPLPPTDAILKSLIDGHKIADHPQDIEHKQAGGGSGLNQEQKTVLESCLAGFIGPMAGIICEDHLDVAVNLQAAIDALAAEIPSPEQAKKFKAMVLEKFS